MSKIKINRKVRLLTLSFIIVFTLISCVCGFLFLNSSDSFSLQNFDKNIKEYELLYSKLVYLQGIKLLMNYRAPDFACSIISRNRMKMMINGYYSKDWIFTPTFIKFDSVYSSIYSFEYENKPDKKYSLLEIESELNIDPDSLVNLLALMQSLNVKVINRMTDIIEFTDESFLNSTSLDYYEGYLYNAGPKTDLENKKHYIELKLVRDNWFRFKKARIVFGKVIKT